MTVPIIVYPFQYKDARSGRWVNACYQATPEEIAAHYAAWDLIRPGEERRPIGGHFAPSWRKGE